MHTYMHRAHKCRYYLYSLHLIDIVTNSCFLHAVLNTFIWHIRKAEIKMCNLQKCPLPTPSDRSLRLYAIKLRFNSTSGTGWTTKPYSCVCCSAVRSLYFRYSRSVVKIFASMLSGNYFKVIWRGMALFSDTLQ